MLASGKDERIMDSLYPYMSMLVAIQFRTFVAHIY